MNLVLDKAALRPTVSRRPRVTVHHSTRGTEYIFLDRHISVWEYARMIDTTSPVARSVPRLHELLGEQVELTSGKDRNRLDYKWRTSALSRIDVVELDTGEASLNGAMMN